jgi:ectoine hydroxylase-related dioxygenase (phytanoyl-CoA dioxygenase family)
VFVPLIDLTRETGCTRFWVGSHVADGLIGFGGAAGVLRGEVDAIVRAGACVAYDYRTMHRGLGNVSGAVRPVVQFLYARSTYRETKNYGVESLFGSNEEETELPK